MHIITIKSTLPDKETINGSDIVCKLILKVSINELYKEYYV